MAVEYQKFIERTIAINPNLGRLFRTSELMDSFQDGQEAGAKAIVVPTLEGIGAEIATLRDPYSNLPVHTHRTPSPETEILSNGSAFRRGYVVGLAQFLTEHDYTFVPGGEQGKQLIPKPEVLLKDSGLAGYMKGIVRQAPGHNRGSSSFTGLDSKKSSRKDPVIFSTFEPILREAAEQRTLEREGYILGFVAGAVKDFGIKLQSSDIPTEDTAYQVFTQGFNGQGRPMPLDYQLKFDNIPNKASYDTLLLNSPIFGSQDETYYRTGLSLWLASQGVPPENTAIWAVMIRHPRALEGFKYGFEGLPLPVAPALQLPKFSFSGEIPDPINQYPFETHKTIKQTYLESYLDKDSFKEKRRSRGYENPDPILDRLSEDARQLRDGHMWGQRLSSYRKPDKPSSSQN
jgi:hypothetical protein